MAAALLICIGGCLDDSLAPTSAREARLDVHRVVAQVSAGEQATVVIGVNYYTNSEEAIPLPVTPSRIAIEAGATVSQPIVVTLDPCLADPNAYHGGGDGGSEGEGCFLEVTFTLLDQSEAEISSASTVVNYPVVPGQSIELEDIVLSNVWTVEVAPLDTLAPEQSVTAVATAYTKSGAVVSDVPFVWRSYSPTVATVDSATGVVQAVGLGSAYIEAQSGDAYGGTTVFVADPASPDVRVPGGICVTQGALTICPGESSGPVPARRRGRKP